MEKKDFNYKDYLLDIVEDAINSQDIDLLAFQIWKCIDQENGYTKLFIIILTKYQFNDALERIKYELDEDANFSATGEAGVVSAVGIDSAIASISDMLEALILNGKTNFEERVKRHGKE